MPIRIGKEAFYGIWSDKKSNPAPKANKPPPDLEKVVQILKDKREEKGLTLEEIADTLFITRRVLRSMESGDWKNLPPMVYVKGYILQYASLLGISDLAFG